MKKIKYLILTGIITAFSFLSCELPVSLGSMLDLDGPILEIISPAPRKAISAAFTIEGTVSDENPISKILITAVKENESFEKKWRYNGNGTWSISEDNSSTWEPYEVNGIEWNGNDAKASWKLPIDMSVKGKKPSDGEYLFQFQAWDIADLTDDNSFRTRVFIYDSDPPKVDISNPFIHRGKDAIDKSPLKALHEIVNEGEEKFDASFIGQFNTQGFNMQWQIEDNSDVWSIAIRFYNNDTDIDGYPETNLPENFIYNYSYNFPEPPPEIPNINNNAKPNGSIIVPDLDRVAGFYNGAELRNPIHTKTTIKVVTVCYDAAGNANQEKVLGYFIYWPAADIPWIEYTDGMDSLTDYNYRFDEEEASSGVNAPSYKEFLDRETFMIYPGRTIKSTAFHAHGVEKVVYSLYAYDTDSREASNNPYSQDYNDITSENTKRPSGGYSTIYSFELRPPNRSGYYLLKAVATSVNGKTSAVYDTLFRVQDISFPDFIQPITPIASDPLYIAIGNSVGKNSITISGEVRDATKVENLDLVWINPQSTGYAAMSQLSYFREPDYEGWKMANNLIPGGPPAFEAIYDSANPNSVYRIELTEDGIDNETERMCYKFSKTIPISELNIGVSQQPLKSQVFLLRAENPDKRTTIITYAPQGDTSPPEIDIKNIVINGTRYTPRTFAEISQFNTGDKIQINGTWLEDSIPTLDINTYFAPNFNVEINGHVLPKSLIDVNLNTIEQMNGININWRADITVGDGTNQIPESKLRDTLVVYSSVRDIGGNKAESTVSWLIESDHLRLMRVSSEDQDGTYNTGKEVIIFLEFSKPVMLLNTGSNPTLRLNSRGSTPGTYATAVYVPELNTTQSTRQYFKYTVAANDDTTNFNPLAYLDVEGLETTIAWNANNYPFTWYRGAGISREEIRVTNIATHNNDKPSGAPSEETYARRLPTTTINSNGQEGIDYMFTFIAGKRIKIDTKAPTVSSIVARTNAGNYTTGAEISIDVKFNKPVRIGTSIPRLRLQVTNTGNVNPDDSSVNTSTVQTSGNLTNVRVSGETVSFVYRVRAGDTTNGYAIVVTGHTGTIEDLAGTALAVDGISSAALTNRTLTGRFIDTIKPEKPTVRILPSTGNAIDSNVITNIVNGIINRGNSNSTDKTLRNVYINDLRLAIEGNTTVGAHKLASIEYSISGSTTNYEPFANIINTPIPLQTGPYNIIARQIDRAGNESDWTLPVSFTYMTAGDFITRIDSTTANGTYTNNNAARNDEVNITVYFRENITTSGTPTITLNANNGTADITATASNITTAANYISFTYQVQPTDNTPTIIANKDATAANTYTSRNAANTADANHGLGENNTVLQVGVGNLNYWLRILSANTFRLYETQTAASSGGNGSNLGSSISVRLPLDVKQINITALENGVNVTDLITVPGGTTVLNHANRLRQRKMIFVQTGVLRRANLSTGVAEDTATYTATTIADSANDAWSGYFDLRFTRPISKGSGNIVLTQVINTTTSDTLRKYRLPAVLTEAQASKYRSAANFDQFYTRGVNGFSGTAPDTSTKFVLNYAESTIVTPSNTGTPSAIDRMAYDFHLAEIVTIPLSSQDIEIVNGDTLRINLTGSNALAVLGAEYRIVIPANVVQDSLSYTWPSSETPYTYITSGINKPYVRIDKKVNADRIQRAEGNANGTPQMSGIFTNVLQTTARLDCRTPASVVRYNAGWYEHTAVTGDVNAHGHGDGSGNNWRNSGVADAMITFDDTLTNSATNLVQPVVNVTGTDTAATTTTTGVRTYSNFTGTGTANDGPHFSVGNTNESGYTLRIAARSRVTADGTTRNSAYSEEVAFRSVLTYELRDVRGFNSGTANNIGWMPQIGTSLWIRGGDAPSTSSIAGFPLTWDDDYMALAASGARAGVRPMRRVQGNSPQGAANAANAQIWRWITWEVNVNTFNEVILGENYATTPVTITTGNAAATTFQYTGNVSPGPSNHVYEATVGSTPYYLRVISNTNNTFRLYANKGNTQVQNAGNGVNAGNNISVVISAPTTTPTVAQANEAWQFGPREWRYPRGGWVASKHLYTIQPGRHRWVRIDAAQNYAPGGVVNWTTQTNIRPTALTVTAPTNPANQ